MSLSKNEDIYRQRLVFEANFEGKLPAKRVRTYLKELSKELGMTIVFGPRVMRRCEKINPKHRGFEAVMVWAESGVQLYSWEDYKFLTVDIYCCHPFDIEWAVRFTTKHLGATNVIWKEL